MKKNKALIAGVLVLGLAGCSQGTIPQMQAQSPSDNGQQAAADAALTWFKATERGAVPRIVMFSVPYGGARTLGQSLLLMVTTILPRLCLVW